MVAEVTVAAWLEGAAAAVVAGGVKMRVVLETAATAALVKAGVATAAAATAMEVILALEGVHHWTQCEQQPWWVPRPPQRELQEWLPQAWRRMQSWWLRL